MGKQSYPTLNVKPDTHEWMAEFRDENGHNSMDEAVSELIAYYEGEVEPEAHQLDDASIEQLVEQVEARVGGDVDTSDLAREVAARIDTEDVARKTAEKIREDLR